MRRLEHRRDTPTPDVTNPSADLYEPVGIAFDKSNNLWASNFGSGTLTEFTVAQLKALATTNNPAASVVISGLDEPRGLAFDGSGNLWAENFRNSTLVEFTPSQLAAGGPQTPQVTITSTEPSRNLRASRSPNPGVFGSPTSRTTPWCFLRRASFPRAAIKRPLRMGPAASIGLVGLGSTAPATSG